MFRFTLREILLLILVLFLAIMWRKDHWALVETRADAVELATYGEPFGTCGNAILPWILVADKYRERDDDIAQVATVVDKAAVLDAELAKDFHLLNNEISDWPTTILAMIPGVTDRLWTFEDLLNDMTSRYL